MSSADIPRQTRSNIALALVGLLLLIGILVAGLINQGSRARVMTDSELKSNGAYMFETPRALPPFKLVDHHGQSFETANLRGHWTLLFFGFTHCPDVCPVTMAQLARFMDGLEGLPQADDTRVVMVSVDPARDTVERLARYVPYFNPGFVGVTGAAPAIRRFATALNTPFRKAPDRNPHNYQMEHGANLVLINPNGRYHGFFRAPLDPARLEVSYRSVRAVWDMQP